MQIRARHKIKIKEIQQNENIEILCFPIAAPAHCNDCLQKINWS